MANRIRYTGVPASIAKGAAMRRLVDEVAEKVADNVRSQGITVGGFGDEGEIPLPVEVFAQTSDRARAFVALAHPAGLAVQAKHGALTKAAAQAGLEVKGE